MEKQEQTRTTDARQYDQKVVDATTTTTTTTTATTTNNDSKDSKKQKTGGTTPAAIATAATTATTTCSRGGGGGNSTTSIGCPYSQYYFSMHFALKLVYIWFLVGWVWCGYTICQIVFWNKMAGHHQPTALQKSLASFLVALILWYYWLYQAKCSKTQKEDFVIAAAIFLLYCFLFQSWKDELPVMAT